MTLRCALIAGTATMIAMACQVPLVAQEAAARPEPEASVNPGQHTVIVGGSKRDARLRTARPVANDWEAQVARARSLERELPDDSAWRPVVPPGEAARWGGAEVSGGTLLVARESMDADDQPAADSRSPRVEQVRFRGRPQRGDTYAQGNRISVSILFDEDITLSWSGGGAPPVTLALRIGATIRHATVFNCTNRRPGASRCGGPLGGIIFTYDVQEGDHDPDGISIAPDAMRLNGMHIRDSAGNDANLGLGPHAISNDPAHKVNGALDYVPRITDLFIFSRPQGNDTYGRGEEIVVLLELDENVVVTGQPTMALTIGTQTREAVSSGTAIFTKSVVFFHYRVEATDKDADGISIRADALHLTGGSIRDVSGNEIPTNLEAFAIADDPAHKVDGATEYLPGIDKVALYSRPQHGQTYGRGETIEIRISFDDLVYISWPQDGPLPLELTLQVGNRQRRAAGVTSFRYEVQASDYDPDGISIAPDALRLVAGSITDAGGREITDFSLGDHAVADHPAHKVDGRELKAVGTLPPLELVAGTEAVPVDVSQAFQGLVTAYSAESSSPEVATVTAAGAVLTVSPVAEGTATVKVTARNPTATASQSFVVTVIPALEAVGTLPPLELIAGGEAAAVDLAPAFRGRVTSYSAVSSDPGVATVFTAGAVLTVSPVVEGITTVEVTARNANEMAEQSFSVMVVTDPAEVRVLKSTLAALGRSLLASVTTTVEGRFNAAPGRTALEVAGHRLPLGTVATELGATAATIGQPLRPPAGAYADSPLMAARAARAGAGAFRTGRSPRDLTGDELLRASRFLLALDAAERAGAAAGELGTRWTVWGAGDLQTFAGEPESGASYDGNARTAHVGVDAGGERWLAGAVVSRSAGQADYRFSGTATGSGSLATTLTSVQPYLRLTPRDGTAVWTILGAGSGAVENVRAHVGNRREQSTLSMRLGVFGGRQTLACFGSVELAVRGDVGVVRLETGNGAAVEAIDGLETTVQRYRLGMETSYTNRRANGTTLTPFAVIGARHDGGDGMTGTALELQGGVRVADPRTGFGLEAQGRVLTMQAAGRHRERGVSVTALWTPGGTVDRGLSLAVTPRWGAAAGGVDALWREQGFDRRVTRFEDDAGAVNARVGYGMALRAGRVLMPFSELGVRHHEHRWLRVGVRLTEAAQTPAPLFVELAGERTETGWGRVEHRLGLIGALSF